MAQILKFPGKQPLEARAASIALTQVELESHRAELLRYAAAFSFPGEQYLDDEFGAAITRESHEELTRIFKIFGVVELDPSGPDFDLVLSTWFALTGNVGMHIRMREMFNNVYLTASQQFTDQYRAYVDALWSGDMAAIEKGARVLGIQAGVPRDFPRFYAANGI